MGNIIFHFIEDDVKVNKDNLLEYAINEVCNKIDYSRKSNIDKVNHLIRFKQGIIEDINDKIEEARKCISYNKPELDNKCHFDINYCLYLYLIGIKDKINEIIESHISNYIKD